MTRTNSNTSMVVTTINYPTKGMLRLSEIARQKSWNFYVVGDSKSPADFSLPGSSYFSLEDQNLLDLEYARLCPAKHYARKNVGYLLAIKNGAEQIIETDDDNIPNNLFSSNRKIEVSSDLATGSDWYNVYSYFSSEQIWPRGYPLRAVRTPFDGHIIAGGTHTCPIQQGLADENPDVDAIYRLILPLPIFFDKDKTVVLDKGVWCPFNSQNTVWWKAAFPLLYLPFYCSFRMTDIWRSFIAQRLAWECGWKIAFYSSTVFQERNEHDLMRDFYDEVPGYLNNDLIRNLLMDIELDPGVDALHHNLVRVYERLIEKDIFGKNEMQLLLAWLKDLELTNA